MRNIVIGIGLLAIVGCTVTSKEPRDELVARNHALSSEINANEQRAAMYKWMQEEIQRNRAQTYTEWVQSRGGGLSGCSTGRCGQPVSTQPVPQQPIFQPQPQQPIIIIPSQPSIQPIPQPQPQPQQPIFIQPMPPVSTQPVQQPSPMFIQPVPQQSPVYIQPMPQPNPVSIQPMPQRADANCHWRAEPNGSYVWVCIGGPVAFPTQPGQGTPGIENPHFHDEKQ